MSLLLNSTIVKGAPRTDGEAAFVLGKPGWDQTTAVLDETFYVRDFHAIYENIEFHLTAAQRREVERLANWRDWLKGIEQRRRAHCRS